MAATVRDLMTKDVITVGRTHPMDLVYALMLERGIRHVPVVDDDDELAGIISHRDVAALLGDASKSSLLDQAGALDDLTAGQVMTRGPETVEPEMPLRDAAELMFEQKVGCLPVCEGSHLVGILTEADFVAKVARGE